MSNYKGPGTQMKFTAGRAYSADDGVVIGKRVGVCPNDVADTAEGIANIVGQYEMTVLGTDVVTVGALLYWDDGNTRLTLTASTHELAGYAATASPDGVTTVEVILAHEGA